MLRIYFKINHYDLNLCNYDDDDDDYYFLERISERYDYMLYRWHDHSSQYFKLELDEGYNIKVALYDILSIIPVDSLEELEFNFCFDKPFGLYQ